MNASVGRLSSLATQLAEGPGGAYPPVDRWNPPYCGDIGLAIRRDGSWTYQGSPINRPAIVRLFSRVLRRDEDGQHYLVTPVEKVLCCVEDAPFVAVELEISGIGRSQSLVFRTNMDDLVACGPEAPLRFAAEGSSGGLKPYVLVRGRLEALLSRPVCHELLNGAVEHDSAGRAVIWSNGTFFQLP